MNETLFDEAGQSPEDQRASSIAGSLIGSAAADAVGWMIEFVRGRQHLRELYGVERVTDYRPWHKTSGGRFFGYRDDIGAGEYSDDTQLTLAVARSLNGDGSVDPVHFAKRELPLWLDYSRGAGSTITHAAQALRQRQTRWDRNFFSYTHRGQRLSSAQSGANGAAMRVAPIALANAEHADRMEVAVWESAIPTHGHPRAILGALLYAEALRRTACASGHGQLRTTVEELAGYVANRRMPEDGEIRGWIAAWPGGGDAFARAWMETRDEVLAGLKLILAARPGEGVSVMHHLGCYDPETRGSGVGTVLAALLIAMSTQDDFEHAIVTAINQLGTDTDTIGGFVGGILGARLGYMAVPVPWAQQLQDYEYLMRVSVELATIAEGRGLGCKALLPAPHIVEKDPPNLLDLLKAKRIEQGQAVYHPLFGYGKVRSVETQALRRTGYSAYFAWVDFDLGQSCKFRYIKADSPDRTTTGTEGALRALGERIGKQLEERGVSDEDGLDTAMGEVTNPDIADRIEGTYLQVAEAMQAPDRLTLELPDTITKPARAIVRALDGDIKEIRFEAQGQVVDIVSPARGLERSPRIGA